MNILWCLSPNFGDALGPWLMRKMAPDGTAIWTPRGANYRHYALSGSILNWSNEHTRAWGVGIGSISDEIHPETKIHCVRGPISRLKAQLCGCKVPAEMGDSGLYAPELYNKGKDEKYELGIVPHYVDMFRVEEKYRDDDSISVIDPLQGVEVVVDQIRECRRILSSSLHGLIFADAYRIPNAWAMFGDSIGGDGMKYWDYLASVGRATLDKRPHPVDFRARELPGLHGWLSNTYVMGDIEPRIKDLKRSRPFRK